MRRPAPMSASSCLLLLSLCLLLSIASVVSVTLPPVPTEYSTTVEFNFGLQGYTLSYDEYYSQPLSLLRADGRYDARTVVELTSWSGSSVVMKSINGADTTPCTAYTLTSAQNASLLYAPTYAMWQLMNYSGFSWTNLGYSTMGDRQVNSTHYQSGSYTLSSDNVFCNGSSCDSTGGVYGTPPWSMLEMLDFAYSYDNSTLYSATFSLDVYLDVVPNGSGLPLRIQVSGSRVNSSSSSAVSTPFNNTYDWTNFKRLDRSLLTALRQTYLSCRPTSGATSFRAPFPSSNTVSTTYQTVGSAPPSASFPDEFTMIVEGQTAGPGNGGPGAGTPGQQNANWAMRYTLDEANLQESLQQQSPWSLSLNILMWQYSDASAYPRSGQFWRVGETMGTQGQGPVSVNCTTANLTWWGPQQNSNPLRASRAYTVGSFADFFLNVSNFDETTLSYTGKSYVRSVWADVYSGSFSGQAGFGNITLQWTTSVYLFPSGWQYPGRNTTADQRLPMLIVNNGSATGQYNYTFTDTWNVFSLIPETGSGWFTDLPAAYNCPMTVSQQNGGSPPTPPRRSVNPPFINSEYSTTVEISFSTLGYTLSYDEYYSASQGLLRADGRYNSRAITEITSFISPVTMTAYNVLTSSCASYSLTAAQNASLLYAPTYAVLQLLNYSGLLWTQQVAPNNAFVPTMIADRNIPATLLQVGKVTILPNGTFCDASNYCDDADGDLSAPPYSFLELLNMATSPEGEAETNVTTQQQYTTVLSINFFIQTMTKAGVTGAIPLRLELNGTQYAVGDPSDAGTPVVVYYDWTNWRSLDTTVFTAITSSSAYSAGCTAQSTAYRAPFPNTTSVEASTITVGSAPLAASFPSQFVMQVEGLVAEFSLQQRSAGGGPGGGGMGGGPNIGNNSGNAPVNYAARWSYDSVGDQESISTYADNYTLAANATILIYEYGTEYADGGEVWQVTGSAAAYTCTDAELTVYDENPLQSERGGVISFTQLFTNDTYDLSNFGYVGRSTQRGVQADWYRASFTKVPSIDAYYYGNLTFTYTANLYLFPVGWVFPGRANSGDLRLPLRVTFSGTQTNLTSGVTTTFLDAYNVFELYPASDIMAASSSTGLVSSAWFTDTPSAYSCPSYSNSTTTTTTTGSGSSGLSGGAIAGIVIAVLVGVAVLVFLWLLCQRRGGMQLLKSFKQSSTSGSSKWKQQEDDTGDEPSVSQNSPTAGATEMAATHV